MTKVNLRDGQASPAIVTAIATLEAQARDFETKAGVCRETAQLLREAFEVSPLGPIVDEPGPATRATRPSARNAAESAGQAGGRESAPVRKLVHPVAQAPAAAPVSPHVHPALIEDPMPIDRLPRPPAAAPPTEAPRVPRRQFNLALEKDRQALQAAVRQILERAGAPLRSGLILQELQGSNIDQLRVVLADLVELELVTREGERSATVYTAVSAPPQPAATIPVKATGSADAGPAMEPVPPVAPEPASWLASDAGKAKVAFFLLQSVFEKGAPVATGDIVIAVHDKFGAAPWAELAQILTELASQQAITSLRVRGELHYQLVAKPLRSKDHAPAAPDARLLGEINRILASGASHTGLDILRKVRAAFPALTAEGLDPVLDQLARERRIEPIRGAFSTRFRKVATARASA